MQDRTYGEGTYGSGSYGFGDFRPLGDNTVRLIQRGLREVR